MHKFEISVPCIHCVQLSVQYTVPVVHEGLGHVLDEGDAQLDVGAEVEDAVALAALHVVQVELHFLVAENN